MLKSKFLSLNSEKLCTESSTTLWSNFEIKAPKVHQAQSSVTHKVENHAYVKMWPYALLH